MAGIRERIEIHLPAGYLKIASKGIRAIQSDGTNTVPSVSCEIGSTSDDAGKYKSLIRNTPKSSRSTIERDVARDRVCDTRARSGGTNVAIQRDIAAREGDVARGIAKGDAGRTDIAGDGDGAGGEACRAGAEIQGIRGGGGNGSTRCRYACRIRAPLAHRGRGPSAAGCAEPSRGVVIVPIISLSARTLQQNPCAKKSKQTRARSAEAVQRGWYEQGVHEMRGSKVVFWGLVKLGRKLRNSTTSD